MRKLAYPVTVYNGIADKQANSGDSRAVLGYKGQEKPMSHDHKPTNKGKSTL
jgi:serine/threonine protein phosphatase PrpC